MRPVTLGGPVRYRSRASGMAARRSMRSASRIARVAAAVLWSQCAIAVGAQAPAPPKFEVASVKANKSGATQVSNNWQGGVTMINMPLRAIVQFAYGINTPSRIVGHPDWTNVERFDIQAKPPAGITEVE